jgi:UDP-N-acetylmuramoyl-L-alanyl-D-glutamate--2,6-diaminopimelate ligase
MHRTQLRRAAISLRQTLPRASFIAADDVLAASCTSDWRACRAGSVFVAVLSADDDGHDHAAAAIERGAIAIVTERLLPVSVPQVVVRDSRVALGQVCQALAGNPTRELRTIGITGSAGKTVTAMLIAAISEAAGQAVGVMSSVGHSDSQAQESAQSATPSAEAFASWLTRMQTAGCETAVLELSHQALAERRTSGIELDAAIVTNVHAAAVADAAGSNARGKMIPRIFEHLKEGGLGIVNADDHRCRRLLTEVPAALTYGLYAEADVTARVIERHASEQTFLLCAGSDVAPVRTRMIGDAHVSNCLAAAAVGLASGIELPTIVRGLEAVERVPGRMERLECGQPYSVFVDGADTAERLTRSIKTIREVTPNRVFVVFGGSERRAPAKNALLGRVLERGAHVAVITSDEPGESRLLESAHELLDGFERPQRAQLIPNRKRAIEFALDIDR